MQNNLIPQSEIYFRKANADLKLAKYALDIVDEELDMEIIFFHLQQAAEKYLKAILSCKGIHFGKIHDIERLITIIEQHGLNLPAYVQDLVDLNPYAVEGRYAVLVDDVSDADKYIKLLDDLKSLVATELAGDV